MPLKYWDEAVLTSTFLLNLLPSKVINSDAPAERLLHVTQNYDALRTFGCACWPNLLPYNTRKLAFCSKRCVFIGYSSLHKGVKCLDISTGRVYISRDVVFDENVFPFASPHPNAGALLRKEIILLPSTSSILHEGVPRTDDHTSPILPITNVLQADEELKEIFSKTVKK
jgi:histone deacetylase 1/2